MSVFFADIRESVDSLYHIFQNRGSCKNTTAVTYEEVGVAGDGERSHDIQLTSNEAYGPIKRDNIQTSHNTAYGQV